MISWSKRKNTWASLFVELMVKACFLPISIEGDKIAFKIFSWKTFFHCLMSLGYYIIMNILIVTFSSIGWDNIFDEEGMAADVSMLLMSLSMMTGLLIPAILSAGLTNLSPEVILRNDLRFPETGYRNVIGKMCRNILVD